MAVLILEITDRHGPRYYRIDKPVIRVGRALDNDIILADPAVSPHHFLIRRDTNGEHSLQSLTDENGIRIGGKRLADSVSLSTVPISFDAGRTRIRILDSANPVAPTRLIGCHNGRLCVFGNRGWALLFFCSLFIISALDNYLSTPQLITWESFGNDQLIITLSALSISIGLLVVNRITSQRWDYAASLSFVSLVLIIGILLDQFALFIDYYFNSSAPSLIINTTWYLILIPLAMSWFLIRLNHGSAIASIVSIIILLTPAAYIQANETADYYGWFEDFDKKAYYSSALSPWDMRRESTISIDTFVDSVQTLITTNDD